MGSSRRWMKLISIGKNRSSLNKGETKKAQIGKPWKPLSSFSKRFTLYRRDQGLAQFKKNGVAQEESAAIAIQTAYRVFLAKRALRALKGLVRLEVAITGHEIRNQSAVNVPSIQAFVRVQARIRRQQAAKNRDALGLPQQNSSTFAVEISPGDSETEWCSSLGTIEELQAKEHQRHVAAQWEGTLLSVGP
ncbi:hypothetical protein KP509_01G063900 [Ceratopteris richardii]|uniref:Uncharacterized protein n=1 Tax=Ceratopteris richardii TaxID=49495 RepID=A0A8T2VQ69_CERRI|nr:hypothetical protein KP509_01G063900 [Ceratopteris richardii]